MKNKLKALGVSFMLCFFSSEALSDNQLFTKHYELSIPYDVSHSVEEELDESLLNSIKKDITDIVNLAPQLKYFPIRPQILKKVQFQPPLTTAEFEGVELLAFTVTVPLPDPIRNVLLKVWFNSDVFITSESGHHLRLHKERGGQSSDVGIIVVRSTYPDGLRLAQIEKMIRSFSTY